jgi:Ca2+/Na+ antiporter
MLIIVGLLAALTLTADLLFVSARNAAFGAIYLLLGLAPGLILLVDYARFDKLAPRPMLLGLDLMTLFKAASPFLDLQIRPMVGLYLVGAGLALLLFAGVLRVVAPMARNSERN